MNIKISKCFCTLLCTLLFCDILLCVMPTTAFASEIDEVNSAGSAVISAQVPSSHTLTVSLEGAEVFVDGAAVNGMASLSRQSTPTLLIRANSNRHLKEVLLNGKDITAELKSGMFTLPKVIANQTLVVTTVEDASVSAIKYTVTGTVKQNGKPVSGITLELRSELKTFVTGNDGTFRFENVESGRHSLTALKDGKVVGYTEFTLISGSVELNYIVAEDGTINITVPSNTAIVNFDLNLTEDGVLQVVDVQVTEGSGASGDSDSSGGSSSGTSDGSSSGTSGDSPDTGDVSYMGVKLLLLVVSCGIFVGFAIDKKRKECR